MKITKQKVQSVADLKAGYTLGHADVAQAIEKLKRKLVECNRYNYCADAVKGVEYACHAAMLQDSEPVTDNTNQQFESLSRGDK